LTLSTQDKGERWLEGKTLRGEELDYEKDGIWGERGV